MDRPKFQYDSTCPFCRAWVKRWRHAVGDAVDFQPFPEGKKPVSSEFVAPDGKTYLGAHGVFQMLATASPGRLLWCYRHLPLFALCSEALYRLVSSCRVCAYKFTKWLVHE